MEEEKQQQIPQESDVEASVEGQPDERASNKQAGPPAFPEGGVRAWSVAIGCSGVLFSTFGYVNAFGYAPAVIIQSHLLNKAAFFKNTIKLISSYIKPRQRFPGSALFKHFSFSVAVSLVDHCLTDLAQRYPSLVRSNISSKCLINLLLSR